MANYHYGQNYGKVARLYPASEDGGRVYFKLKDGKTAMNPTRGYYFIPARLVNYNALVALLYMAANVGYTIKVRTTATLVGGYAEVQYLVLDL